MDMTIAILLWLQVMVPYGEYSESEYDQMVSANSGTISFVLGDPTTAATVWNQWGYIVPTVVVNTGDEINVGHRQASKDEPNATTQRKPMNKPMTTMGLHSPIYRKTTPSFRQNSFRFYCSC